MKKGPSQITCDSAISFDYVINIPISQRDDVTTNYPLFLNSLYIIWSLLIEHLVSNQSELEA